MPFKYIPPEIAFEIDGVVIDHVYKDDDIEDRLEYWFEHDGVEFDIRDLIEKVEAEDPSDYKEVLSLAIRGRVGPFASLPARQTFHVEMLVDAYAVYSQEIMASSPEEAFEIARKRREGWGDPSLREFDDTQYEVFDQDLNSKFCTV